MDFDNAQIKMKVISNLYPRKEQVPEAHARNLPLKPTLTLFNCYAGCPN